MSLGESSSRSNLLFGHDLRANAPRLSRGKTGTHPSGRSSRACFSGSCSRPSPRSAQHVVFLEPGLHLVPSILGGFLAVARAIIGVEAVRGARIDLELSGLFVFGHRPLHRFYATAG